jgi:hypothetical protein
MIRTIKSITPNIIKSKLYGLKHIYNSFQYSKFLLENKIDPKQILILATITKCGTHFFRFVLANYLNLLENPNARPVEPLEIDNMLPNGWHTTYLKVRPFKEPSFQLKQIGLFDMPRSHMTYQSPSWKKSRVLHMYRNPLDFALFLYLFKYEYYEEIAGRYSSPAEVFIKFHRDYVDQYLSFRSIASQQSVTLLSFSWEDFIEAPQLCLSTVLRWLGFEPHLKILDKAVEFSKLNETSYIGAGERWQRDGTNMNNANLLKHFTNDCLQKGSVGQWKNYFSKSEVNEIELLLNKYSISLNDFRLEL